MEIGDLYEAIVDDDAYAALPAMIATLLDARSGFIQSFEAGALIDARYSYCSKAMVDDILRQHPGGVDVWASAGLRHLVPNRAGLIDDWVSPAAFEASLLSRIFRAHGDDTGHSMAILHHINGTALGLSVQRPAGHPFGAADAARLDALAPDLHRIHRARALLRGRDAVGASLTRLLDAGRSRVLLLGPDLLLLEASADARALLDAQDGLGVRQGRLTTGDPHLAHGLRHAVNQSIGRRSVDPATFVVPRRTGAPWRLLVLPMPAAETAGCALVVTGGDRSTDRMRFWLDRHYHATAAEIEVSMALLDGRTPEEIALDRGVSINTVRSQIRHLLEKTGTRGVNGLVMLLMSLE